MREFAYDVSNEKYRARSYLYGREMRWSHRELLKFSWRGRRTLEIGCFNGFFVAELARFGADAHGVDVNSQALHVGREFFALQCCLHGTLEQAASFGPFDDVLCIDLLEHLDRPEGILAQIFSLLRPGGRLFIAGPTVERRFFDRTDHPPHHRWRFSRGGLGLLLERSGFHLQSQSIQYDGMLLLRNFVGKFLSGHLTKREFYGDIGVAAPSTESGLIGSMYRILTSVGTLLFTAFRIPYCSALLMATKDVDDSAEPVGP